MHSSQELQEENQLIEQENGMIKGGNQKTKEDTNHDAGTIRWS